MDESRERSARQHPLEVMGAGIAVLPVGEADAAAAEAAPGAADAPGVRGEPDAPGTPGTPDARGLPGR